jgi:hypothetical protein
MDRVNACNPLESQQKERRLNILKDPNDHNVRLGVGVS